VNGGSQIDPNQGHLIAQLTTGVEKDIGQE